MSVPPTDPYPPPRLRLPWLVLFLAGPVIWYLHFWAVYLVSEAVCTLGAPGWTFLGLPALSVMVVVATIVAVALIAYPSMRAWRVDRHAGHRQELAWVGGSLGMLFALGVVFVGLPALAFPPC